MYDEILFHGTELSRGEKMIKWQNMFNSEGDRHWLGDGGYFYEDDFYAYKWIRDMYKDKHQHYPNPPVDIFKEYGILKSKVLTDKNRVFDLDRPLNKIEFDRVHANCLNLKKYSKRFSDVEMQEGVVINIMFQDMGYDQEYDIVIATFKSKSKKYNGIPMRLNFMSEKQICVKNLGIAVPIEFFKCNDKLENFHYCIDNLYYVTELEQTGTDSDIATYSSKNKRRSSYQRKIHKKK